MEISVHGREGFLNLALPLGLRFRKMDCGPLMTNFHPSNRLDSTVIASSAAVFGSLSIPSLTIDRQFGMEPGKLRNRAGIRSVSHAAPNETEVSLGMRAAIGAFESAKIAPDACDWVFASSETHHTFPSLAADLHAGLGLPETCGALDIGGACLGLLHELATAQAFIANGPARRILVVTSDVHSRTLTSERVQGEFGGLFGDGATAFIVQDASRPTNDRVFGLGEFFFGCAAQFAKAIEIKDSVNGELKVVFEGDALSRAAITKMAQVISELEQRSGFSRQNAIGFATHQPNPRLVSLLAKQTGVASDRFPAVAEIHGNLGSSTCGAALHELLVAARKIERRENLPIFLASLGPGLLFGGGWLAGR